MSLLNLPKTTIAFQAGGYGHYIKWLIYTLMVEGPIVSPFEDSTSHSKGYIDKNLLAQGYVLPRHVHVDDLTLNNNVKLSTIHPVTDLDMDFFEENNKISKAVDKVIIPYFDASNYLLGIHNFMFKLARDDIDMYAYINKEELAIGWNVDPTIHFTQLPQWIQREHLSINFFTSYNNMCGWFAPTKFQKNNCKYLFISDLFYNFLDTIENLRNFLEVKWIRDPADLLPYHKTNVANQEYIKQDIVARQILHSVFTSKQFKWESQDITVFTEAYLQKSLQQQGIVLQCYGLNNFPTSTEALIEVLE